jgi:hypothetical protein
MTQATETQPGGFTFWGLLAIIALIVALALGCATTPTPQPATGPLLDPVWHTEVLNVTVDHE